jgi:hypothetical protein
MCPIISGVQAHLVPGPPEYIFKVPEFLNTVSDHRRVDGHLHITI